MGQFESQQHSGIERDKVRGYASLESVPVCEPPGESTAGEGIYSFVAYASPYIFWLSMVGLSAVFLLL